MPLSQAGAEQAAGGQAEQALHNLARPARVAVVDHRVEGVQPRFHAVADVREDARGRNAADREGDAADQDPA